MSEEPRAGKISVIMDMTLFQNEFSPFLKATVHDHIQVFTKTTQDAFLGEAVEHISMLVGGGKRLRPYLSSIGYVAGGGQDRALMMRFGVALELFHVFCLIHDDIIDKAATRRNVATIEAFVQDHLRAQARRGDLSHLAKSHAILLGDLVFSWASRHMCATALLSPLPQTVLDEYYGMVDEVVAGQMIDVDTMTRDEHDEGLLERKMYLKTAGYSFVRPLCLGLRLSGNATEKSLAEMTAIGTPMGLAFQLQDDVFDITSSVDVLGKPILSDIRDGQQTFLTAFVAQHGTPQEKLLLERVMHGFGSDEDIRALRETLVTNGAVARAQFRMNELWESARDAINHATFPHEIQEALHTLVVGLQSRVL